MDAENVTQVQCLHNLMKKSPEWQQLVHSKTNSSTFRLKGRHADLRIELRLPSERTTTKSDDVTSSRPGAVGIFWRLSTMKTSKVCITPAVKSKITSRPENKNFVGCALEVSQDHLHSSCMTLLGV
jgi:hypothetical protein